ncbi:hypothetical protein [Paenibacillus oryzisoli]|uniref:RiboL-PSP-HEPN domain-containing protein n=1 Tax=Paenibacillus oryzisoli TaxID=1850517 RepID=A0A198A5L0_9BACL|nr:hypothetical protein [Paenibacillus oryzisoli]OAS16764.1 hypothetical protein A8708_07815 [Paenibacillus oryzisoli]
MEDEKQRKVKVNDIRMCQPVGFRSKEEQQIIFVQLTESFEHNEKNVYFYRPNNVSLCMNISKKESEKAKKIYKQLVEPKLSIEDTKSIEFKEEETSTLYDYFEHIHTSLIFIYTAVEAFANLAIPNTFEYEKVNNKGIKEICNKENIERWMPTSEKLIEILPMVLKTTSPKDTDYWSKFKKLEGMRNDLIHQKTISDMKVFIQFLDKEIFELIGSGFKLLTFFCKESSDNPFFPMGFGKRDIIINDVETFDDIFELIEEGSNRA